MKKKLPHINYDGTKIWYDSLGYYHREDGLPAVEFVDGTKSWWKNGVIYRWDQWITWL